MVSLRTNHAKLSFSFHNISRLEVQNSSTDLDLDLDLDLDFL